MTKYDTFEELKNDLNIDDIADINDKKYKQVLKKSNKLSDKGTRDMIRESNEYPNTSINLWSFLAYSVNKLIISSNVHTQTINDGYKQVLSQLEQYAKKKTIDEEELNWVVDKEFALLRELQEIDKNRRNFILKLGALILGNATFIVLGLFAIKQFGSNGSNRVAKTISPIVTPPKLPPKI